MEIGSFEIPDVRLYPDTVADIKVVYEAVGEGNIGSLDMAKTFGYATHSTKKFYDRLGSMVQFGFLETVGRGIFRVTDLGKRIPYPEDENDKKKLFRQAFMNVPLWKELYGKFQKNPPAENFWVTLKNIAGTDSPTAQKIEKEVKARYLEDVALVSDEIESEKSYKQPDSNKRGEEKQMAAGMQFEVETNVFGKLIAPGISTVEITDEDTLTLAESVLGILRKKIAEKIKQSSTSETESSSAGNQIS